MPASTPQPTPATSATSSSKNGESSSDHQSNNQQKDSNKEPTSNNLNIILLCCCLLGIGTITGYTVFYFIFRGKCANLLTAKDQRHNASQVELQSKYSRALTDVRQCQEDSNAKGELQELQGRLQAQAKLSDKHQDLLERHERTLERISQLQASEDASKSQIQTLQDQVKTVHSSLETTSKELGNAQRERDVMQRDLTQQMSNINNLLQDRETESMELRELLDSCDDKIKNAEGQLAELRNLVQQQNYANIVAMFGEGPYIVRFNLEFPYEPVEPNYFEIKIFNARDMPHTVLTFLNLIDNGLYVDTTIDFQKDKIIKGGSLASVEPQAGKNLRSTVLRRFANFGYSAHNTLFFENESSPNAPCRHSSFGLHERGPGFIIYLTNDIPEGENPNNCPGVIVKGRDTLERVLHAHTNTRDGGELTWKVPIVATYLASVEDEL
ncbi:expressed unknown protein [Seminavis robusta]|uniref:PPIase cyclophilin-type domain-containing protein n=1 Tax=Seminavis robusta TaxID=568900 RepID=A0A9N8D804_9STRA|nr:expressed unknown protein [Seminavis robusta]|eukprot:Sro30_g019790.1 n/a (440) ;mRNA; r:127618-129021